MRFTVTTQPEVEPLSLEDAKEHLRVLHDDEDAKIGSLITAARAYVEEHTARALCEQTITLSLCGFPRRIELPRPPAIEVNSITYVDTSGTTQILDDAAYRVSTSGEPGFIDPAYNTSWPSTLGVADSVTVEYVAGFGAAEDVPALYVHAVKLMLTHLYDNPGMVNQGSMTEMPHGLKAVLSLLSWGDL